MQTYIFKVTKASKARGFNRTVTVYALKNNAPHFVGVDDRISTAAYKGDYAAAADIISRIDGHSMAAGGYRLAADDIQIFEI